MGYNDKVFFHTGEIVKAKRLRNAPEMMVSKVHKVNNDKMDNSRLLGITCVWFMDTGEIQEHMFNTKDIEKC